MWFQLFGYYLAARLDPMLALLSVLLTEASTKLANAWPQSETGLTHAGPRTLDCLGIVEHFVDWTVAGLTEARHWAQPTWLFVHLNLLSKSGRALTVIRF